MFRVTHYLNYKKKDYLHNILDILSVRLYTFGMDPQVLALSVVILLFSVVIHEVMHGWVALKFGDHTAERAGRLTLNPIPHIDPIGTILLPGATLLLNVLYPGSAGFLIGWAKPVPVNPLNFSELRKGELFVSLAGVTVNFALAVLAALLFHIFGDMNYLIARVLVFAATINLTLGVFNLLPIPPLDGSKALMAVLPYNLAREYERLSNYGIFIILFLLYFGIVGPILSFFITPLYMILGLP